MTIKEQKEKCVNCHYGRKCSGWNLRFIGCFHEPFNGRWVAEIDKCPKDKPQEGEADA